MELPKIPRWTGHLVDPKTVMIRFPRPQFITSVVGKDGKLRNSQDILAFIYKYTDVFPSEVADYNFTPTEADMWVTLNLKEGM